MYGDLSEARRCELMVYCSILFNSSPGVTWDQLNQNSLSAELAGTGDTEKICHKLKGQREAPAHRTPAYARM